MAVAQSVPSFPLSSLDRVLEKIAEKLQLSPTAYERAKRSYETIGDLLDAKKSPLAQYHPKIYPQGSARIGTTVKPWGREEYDVDLVCELQISKESSAMVLLDVVQEVLESDERYKKLLERKNRCLRLNYVGDFHLDVLPACPDPEQGGTAVLVPDCKLQGWSPSNPEGYAKWVDMRADLIRAIIAEKAAAFPKQQPVNVKPVLKIAIQLLKRWRDIKYAASPKLAPVSVVLTTLAAVHYRGEQSVAEGLENILQGIVNSLPAFGRLQVFNPTNALEDFSEKWNDRNVHGFCKRDSGVSERMAVAAFD
jgi:hypothetical protein